MSFLQKLFSPSSLPTPTPTVTTTTTMTTTTTTTTTTMMIAEEKKEEKEDEGAKEWSFSCIFPDEMARKAMEQFITTIEEVYLLQGSSDATKLAMDLTTTTGYLLEYQLLQQQGGISLQEEAKRMNYLVPFNRTKSIRDAARASKKPEYIDKAMTDDRLSGLILYTSRLYSKVNEALRKKTTKKGEAIVDYVQFAASFIQGYRLLPSFWGTCYRGTVWDPSSFQVGEYPVFEAYTSATMDIDVARSFYTNRTISDPKHKRILFTIHSRSGRSLEEISIYPKEKEIVFRPYTTFLVKKVVKAEGDIYEIELEEAYPDIRGRKVLVWIDDINNKDRKVITDESDKRGVTVVHLHSTKEAKDFFQKHQKLLERGIDKLRIMTDMVRSEKGEDNKDAGVELAQYLKESKYNQGILCFTGRNFLKEKREKFIKAGLPHVYVTAILQEAQVYASFIDLPGSLPTNTSISIPIVPSSSSSSSSSSDFSSSSSDKN